MSNDISDLRPTIIPKSDQLNSEQLLTGSITVTITEVRLVQSPDQPVIIHYEGDDGRPYKPCKTMRKVLILAWGENGNNWVGKSMTLYNDPDVRFGGVNVGGIRISHLSHLDREVAYALAVTKGKKAPHTVKPLRLVALADVLAAIESATGRETMAQAKDMAARLLAAGDIAQAKTAYQAKAAALKSAAGA